jgi:hypothetical protein
MRRPPERITDTPRRIKRYACNRRTGCPTQPSVVVCMDRTHRRPRQLAKGVEQRNDHAKAIGHEKLPPPTGRTLCFRQRWRERERRGRNSTAGGDKRDGRSGGARTGRPGKAGKRKEDGAGRAGRGRRGAGRRKTDRRERAERPAGARGDPPTRGGSRHRGEAGGETWGQRQRAWRRGRRTAPARAPGAPPAARGDGGAKGTSRALRRQQGPAARRWSEIRAGGRRCTQAIVRLSAPGDRRRVDRHQTSWQWAMILTSEARVVRCRPDPSVESQRVHVRSPLVLVLAGHTDDDLGTRDRHGVAEVVVSVTFAK